jgi:hypothetical protein
MCYVTDRAAGIGEQHAKRPRARDQLIAALLLVPCPCCARPPQLISSSLAALTATKTNMSHLARAQHCNSTTPHPHYHWQHF